MFNCFTHIALLLYRSVWVAIVTVYVFAILNGTWLIHGGTTEERICSYLLPRAAAAGSNGTNKGQIHQVPFDEIARFLVYRMDVTRSQLSAINRILLCLFREIWQFKVVTGNEVSPHDEEGNSEQFRAGKKVTHFNYKWFIDIWQTDTTERKGRS